MILTIILVLIILWILGIAIHVGGALINLILLIALVIIVYDFVTRRHR